MALKILPKVVQHLVGPQQIQTSAEAMALEPTKAAAAPRPLQMTLAKIDEELPALADGRFAVPDGYRSSAPVENRKHTATAADGRKATLDWSDQSLTVRDRRGNSTVIVPKDEATYEELKNALDEQVQGSEPGDDSFPHDWFSAAAVNGVGTAGKMISVRNTFSAYTGGAHPYGGSMYGTYDARTGEAMNLDQLLSPEQFRSLVEQIQRKLPQIDEFGSFTPVGSSEDGTPTYDDWAELVKANYAFATDAHGDRYIRVGWESGIHALGSLAARFTFRAPTDAAFLEKIGAQ